MSRRKLEVFKFAVYVALPLGVMAISSSQAFQDAYVKPFTLYPSALTYGTTSTDGKQKASDQMELQSLPYPVNHESRADFNKRLEE